ncbi:MAG: SpoIIE family protein phosphatase [Acidimicrobiales bacterium]|nr:SpoIIE family protein phosphatase [Acidimicrobiales bacterium]
MTKRGASSADWLDQLADRSEMGTLVARFDWAATCLGPPESWAPELRAAVQTCLSIRFPVLLVLGTERICVYNDAYSQILGTVKHPAALGIPAADVWPEIWDQIGPEFDRVYRTGMANGYEDERSIIDRSGFLEECYFRWSLGPILDGRGEVVGVMDVITETTSAVLAQRRLSCLTDLGTELAGARSVTDVSLRAVRALGRCGPAIGAADVYLLVDGELIRTASNRRGSLAPDFPSGDPDGLVAGAASPLRPSDRPVDSVTVPVGGESGGEAVGVIVLTLNGRRPFDTSYVQFVELVASAIGAALDRTRRHDIEIDEYRHIGDTLQRSMLEPASNFHTVAARYLPAAGNLAVGGDWYDVIQLPTGKRGLVVGDCVGHGLDAAAAMSQLRAATRSMLLQGLSPAETLVSLNRYAESVDGAFNATAVCMVVDPARGELTWARAGHPYPLVVTVDGVEWLDEVGGPPLGFLSDPDYQMSTRQLALDDLIVLYSDGLIERRDESIDEGLARLERTALGLHGRGAEDVVDHLVDTLLPTTPSDDVVVVVKQVPLEHTVPVAVAVGDSSAVGNDIVDVT